MRRLARALSLVLTAGALVVGCAPAPAAAPPTSASAPTAKPTAPTQTPTRAAAAPSPSAAGGRVQLGSFAYNDRGTRSVVGESELDLEADDFYFSPTFLRGSPGQQLTLTIDNEGEVQHNFSVTRQQLDKDIAPDATVEVEVTFPPSGALRFFCKYHAAQGMNGQLLASDATPQPVTDSGGGGY